MPCDTGCFTSAAAALLHRNRNQAAEKAAAGRVEREGVAENQAEHARHFAQIGADDIQGHQQIQHGHHRHHHFGHARNAADAAENNRRGEDHQGHAHRVFVPAPRAFGRHHHGVGLHGVINQPEAENQAQRKGHGHPVLFQTLADVIGRPAAKMAVFIVADFEKLRQRRLGKGRTHADQRGYPHPKHRARPAVGNRNRHTGDVAHAHAAGQPGYKRLKGCDAVRVFRRPAPAEHLAHAAPEQAELHKARRQREKQTRAQEQENQPVPQRGVDFLHPPVNQINHMKPRYSNRSAPEGGRGKGGIVMDCQRIADNFMQPEAV